MAPLSVTILYDKANSFGLQEDAAVIERLLKTVSVSGHTFLKPKRVDLREPCSPCDIQFHLEIPVYAAVPWAHTNVIVVNPEHWSVAYDAYVHAFDMLLFRDASVAEVFRAAFAEKGLPADRIVVLPWCSAQPVTNVTQVTQENGFVCFVGGSTHKYEYLKQLLPHWRAEDPPLTIYTTRKDVEEGLKGLTAKVVCRDIRPEERQKLMLGTGHLVVSQAEGFGYAAADAERVGAFTIMNALPVLFYTYTNHNGVAWLSNTYTHVQGQRVSKASPSVNIRLELDEAFAAFRSASREEIRRARIHDAGARFSTVCHAMAPVMQTIVSHVVARRPTKGVVHCPPLLHLEDCPPITIVTPTYNRKKLIEIAFHNLLSTDYPKNRIEWIVIEDNEKTPHLAGEKIMDFQLQVPEIRLKYIPIEGRMSIGEKRNCAIREASHDIILFMDDDDHYPPTSFRRRVAWLTKGVKRGESTQTIACCTTLALYDLKNGTSAVNVPPFDIPFSQRVSEATLAFHKSAWVERPFPHVSIAEGEGWLEGRENQVIEIPPQQIIVAFTHGANQSSRRVPPSDQPPSCFWGFPKEYLIFIHGLAGVHVEEDTRKRS
jgi:hypothetical protein